VSTTKRRPRASDPDVIAARLDRAQRVFGPKVTDADLIARTHRPAEYAAAHGERCYSVVWPDDVGSTPFFAIAAPTLADARRFASEYGVRFLGGARPLDVRWSR
jgi:hypothetical protein